MVPMTLSDLERQDTKGQMISVILLYGLGCCNLHSADLHSLNFTYNRLFMKLFRTKSIDLVKDCRYFFGAVLPSVLVLRKADKLALRY